MRRVYWLTLPLIAVVIFNAVVIFAVANRSSHEAPNWQESTDVIPQKRNFRAISQRMDRLGRSVRVHYHILGIIRYGGESYPISAYTINPQRSTSAAKRVLLTGCVHGDEIAGGEALLRFIEEMVVRTQLYESYSFDIIPIVNPWGWAHNLRYNGNGEDINRDFASKRTEEAQILKRFLMSRESYDLFLDLHESRQQGYFIYQYLRTRYSYAPLFIDLVQSRERRVENRYRDFIFKVKEGVLHIPPIVLWYPRIARRLALDHFMRFEFTDHSYTLETPMRDAFRERIAAHHLTIHRILTLGLLAE